MNEIELNNGIRMPLLGFGVFQITDQQICKESVKIALKTGYRMIDTAACYGNEAAVGEAIRESGIGREEIFLVSKVWIQDAGYEKTMASFEKTLANLGTEYLDLYLIHMPYGDYHGSWRAMEELLKAGRVKAIGVCNFLPDRLLDLILSHEVTPAVNQIELHPFCQQKELRHLMAQYQIQPMAWAPFAEGQNGIFQNPELTAIGQKYGKVPAQVLLRWLRQSKIVAIPKSVHEERIRQNYDVDDFILTEEDMSIIVGMDTGKSLILDVPSLNEVRRLHGIRFEQ
ncbi:MAG: aldo/keto reductase [Eubacteriales bacterium]|nr:aldo/keto reductase [Eubacteriales bacterium]